MDILYELPPREKAREVAERLGNASSAIKEAVREIKKIGRVVSRAVSDQMHLEELDFQLDMDEFFIFLLKRQIEEEICREAGGGRRAIAV